MIIDLIMSIHYAVLEVVWYGVEKIKEGFNIPSDSYIKVIDCNNIKEVVYIDIIPDNLRNYKRISKGEVLNLVTGEIIDVENSITRKDNIKSLRETIKRLRRLINCNFIGDNTELFITLTYADNVTDTKKVYRDFSVFYKRLRRKYKGYDFRYIYCIEPQERGAWHCHVLLKALNKDYLYIPNDDIAELWGNGFTKTQRLEGVDDVGAYLSSYLTNIVDEKGNTKKYARLHLYPVGVNIYRASRNCVRPSVCLKKYQEVLNDYGNCKTYEVSYRVLDEEGYCVNIIKKEFYNVRRFNNNGQEEEGGGGKERKNNNSLEKKSN